MVEDHEGRHTLGVEVGNRESYLVPQRSLLPAAAMG